VTVKTLTPGCNSKKSPDCGIFLYVKRQVAGTPRKKTPAERAISALVRLALVVFMILEALLIGAVVIDVFAGGHKALVPVLEAVFLTLVSATLVYFAFRYARAAVLKLSAAEEAKSEAESKIKTLRENEHALLNAPIAAAALIDNRDTILAINDKAAAFLGEEPEALVGRSVVDLLPPEISSVRERLIQEVGEGLHDTLDFTATHGGRHFRHVVTPIHDERGEVIQMAVNMIDETDEVEAERKLRESEEHYRTLFETSFDGIVYTDMKGCIVACNQSYANMLDYEMDELIGTNVWDLTPVEWQSVDREIIENQLLPSGYSDRYEKRYRRKDGTLVPVNMRAWVVYDASGRPAGAWARVEDISERKQYEDFLRQTIIRLEQANDRLREVDKLKTEFVGIVSHELRAPLATVESGLAAMKTLGEEATADQRRELIAVLGRGLGRLGNLVDDLLDITRIESGQLKLELKPVNTVELARRAMEPYQERFQQKGVELGLEHTDSERPVLCDARRVEQVLTNLLDNALKFTSDGAVIVNLESTPTRVICTVTDSGSGIPPSLQQQVFEKFFTGGSPDGKQGVGLGLAISRGIVDAHGGSMWVESRRGSGATFGFELPLIESQ
jgi:PAS domain S-box-containing protein